MARVASSVVLLATAACTLVTISATARMQQEPQPPQAPPQAVPSRTTLPAGAGRDLVQRMCGTGCHAIEMVTNHRYSAPQWAEIVDSMVVRGAVGTPEEIEIVTKYLATHLGGTEAVPPAPGAGRSETSASVPDSGTVPSSGATGPGRAVEVAASHGRIADAGWPVYGHDPGGQRYSPLTQITPENVAKLRRVWTLTSTPPVVVPSPEATSSEGGSRGAGASSNGAAASGANGASRTKRRGRMSQITPLVINDVMYLTTAANQALALEPETGRTIWQYDIQDMGVPALRGLAYWPGDGEAPPTIFFGTSGGFLIGLNARTGQPVSGFGQDGIVSLRDGMVDRFPDANYGLSSPPVVYKHLVITGSRVQEQPSHGPAGDVRAWDARTGELVWTFRTIPRPGELGHDTWEEPDSWKDRSGANVWGLMTVDVEHGLLFLPIGSVTYDYYGGDRKGANLFGSTLVALDAPTGRRKWHFQTTHHDIWDYDLEAAPTLMDVTRNGQRIPAVAQMTKQGLLFILNRLTGEPIHGVEERRMPQDGFVPSEHPWPTQPFPVKPVPLARNGFDPSELANINPAHRQLCEALLKKDGGLRTGGPYLPFGYEPSLLFPGTLGGGNWHGTSFNPELRYLFVNTQNVGEVYQIVDTPEQGPMAQRWKFWDGDKYWPCQQPPWGELMAVDVDTGEVGWRVPLGQFEALEKLGITDAGTPNMGGSIATAGGLVFIGATLDNKFRAFDARTGREVWSTDVGAAAHSVPITYQGRDGRQYVAVMVSGGGFLGDPTIPATLNVYALP
ncbi:MAG: PQQ-binding-like beta-propeller repeat protein [Luteitalea sp.]|nr:PQQ-binding-like beta-propeller repeat protein [Luteitalea sp.]